MDVKYTALVQVGEKASGNQSRATRNTGKVALLFFGLIAFLSFWHCRRQSIDTTNPAAIARHQVYNLTTGARWMNPDGGRWRVMLVCNGQTPCPTLYAEEGDIVQLNIQSDIGFQSSIHWSGLMHQRLGMWNDGAAGISQYPTLPRGNWTSTFNTSGRWGLNWYAEHTCAGSADGLYGMAYIAPSPSRPRPYHLITKDSSELAAIHEAERNIKHVAIQNHQYRGTDWKLYRMKATGSGFYCYDSILVNDEKCSPGEADYEIIDTEGRSYMMLNIINIGFEHAMKVSIDGHKMIVLANDGGFSEPVHADVVYITNAARVTVLVKLDAAPDDYAIRIASTSSRQLLQGYSILRYPAKRYPVYGVPMVVPEPLSEKCLYPNSNVPAHCMEVSSNHVKPYPKAPPPTRADITIRLKAGVQQSKTQQHVPEFFLNKKPWQIFRGSMTPILFAQNFSDLTDPVIEGLPLGSVVDLVIENSINETIPLYKHGNAAFFLGSKRYEAFPGSDVTDALHHGADFDLASSSKVIVHDLPPLGWSVIRFKVTAKAVTLIHAVKLRYFALGMTARIIEGMAGTEMLDIPHVEFSPAGDGMFD